VPRMTCSIRPFALALALAAATLAVLAAAPAGAATLRLRCAGRGARAVDSAGVIKCAGSPASGRTIAGVVRDDAGRPVAARLTVTYSDWIPRGTGYSITQRTTRQLTAKSDGSFSIRSNPATRETIRFTVVPDAALGTAAGASAEAEIQRRLNVSLKKLGGGTVRVTVSGTRVRPIRVWMLYESGYQLPGVRPRNVNGRGQATFDLGGMRGRFAYYVDAGVYDDLFWYLGRPAFRL
jgi:opacity protein-like surface antigen